MTFIVNQSNLGLPDSESGKLSKLLVWSIYLLVKFPEMEISKVVCT